MRRKFINPVRIETPFELYKQLKAYEPNYNLELKYGLYGSNFVRTAEKVVQIKFKHDFPLSNIIKANRPYASVEHLRAVLEHNMNEVMRLEKLHLRKFVDSNSINIVYKKLEQLRGTSLEIKCTYTFHSKLIILSQYELYHPIILNFPMHILTNNSALSYLNKDFLLDCIEQCNIEGHAKQTFNYFSSVDNILNAMEETFGSTLFAKVHALQEVINSTT